VKLHGFATLELFFHSCIFTKHALKLDKSLFPSPASSGPQQYTLTYKFLQPNRTVLSLSDQATYGNQKGP
jgi:hypothetical protein